MPENQGVNADIWTNEASRILTNFSWEQIGDCNIDIKGASAEERGLDIIFKFKDPYRPSDQVVLFEAKRYATNSFTKSAFEDWLKTLDDKIIDLRHSEDLKSKFPVLDSCEITYGLIGIWFHDYENYFNFKAKLKEIYSKVTMSSRSRNAGYSKIFVITNDEILKLCSVYDIIRNFNRDDCHFYYPASEELNVPVYKTKVLSLDYMFSKFILCENRKLSGEVDKIVFYFGDRDMNSMILLKNALLKLSFLERDSPLKIFFYKEDSEYRIIESEVDKLFECSSISVSPLTHFSGLPSWIQIV